MSDGVFLTPGAARGAYQAGALQFLVQDAGLRFDVVAGCSVGGLNAAFVATGQVDAMVAEWSRWRTRDILVVDWRALLRGAFWRVPSLAHNQPEREVIFRHLDESRLLPGVRLRINLANLQTGDQELFEWPGAPLGLAEAVCASVAVPVTAAPEEIGGVQWADGLTVDGFPLDPLLLGTGVDRAFVIGVAPRRPAWAATRNPIGVLLRALEWNQYSETLVGLARAEAVNDRVRRWASRGDEAREAINRLAPDPAAARQALDDLDAAVARAGFPWPRPPVQVVPILPSVETRMLFGDFRPRRSRALIEQGRADARRAVEALGS